MLDHKELNDLAQRYTVNIPGYVIRIEDAHDYERHVNLAVFAQDEMSGAPVIERKMFPVDSARDVDGTTKQLQEAIFDLQASGHRKPPARPA